MAKYNIGPLGPGMGVGGSDGDWKLCVTHFGVPCGGQCWGVSYTTLDVSPGILKTLVIIQYNLGGEFCLGF